ncbi:hypothetical protein Tco_0482527, partial [Tanacetum coccineum]
GRIGFLRFGNKVQYVKAVTTPFLSISSKTKANALIGTFRCYEVEQALEERESHPINQRVKHPLEPVLDPDLYKKKSGEISLQADRGNGVMCLTMSCKAVYAKYLRRWQFCVSEKPSYTDAMLLSVKNGGHCSGKFFFSDEIRVRNPLPAGSCFILINKEGYAIQANMDVQDTAYFNRCVELNNAYRILGFSCQETKKW